MDATVSLSGRGPRAGVPVVEDGATGRVIPLPVPPAPDRRAAVVRAHADFDVLAGAWDDLWARCPSATPFQTHAWTSAWARAYVPAGQLVVVTVWEDDLLVAAAALHRVRRGLVHLLAPLGGDLSDHTDVLVDPEVPDAGPRLVQALLQVPGWRLVDLPEVLPDAEAARWAQGWPGRVRRRTGSVHLHLPALPVADVLARVPARTAGTLRRKLRRVDRLGIERTEVAPGSVARAVPDLIRLHEAQWAGRRGNPEHLTDRFRQHLVDALAPMIERGQAVFVEYRLDGELMASEVDLVGPEQLAYYLAGISPELRQHIDTAVLLVSGALERATRLEKAEYSFLRGEEDYKLRWRPTEVTSTRLLLARPGLLGSAGYLTATAVIGGALTLARRALRGRARDLARAVMHGLRVLRART
ncbi:GNAT family N-acetyltransferase [Geodermatophilus sp. SYSU D00697]